MFLNLNIGYVLRIMPPPFISREWDARASKGMRGANLDYYSPAAIKFDFLPQNGTIIYSRVINARSLRIPTTARLNDSRVS